MKIGLKGYLYILSAACVIGTGSALVNAGITSNIPALAVIGGLCLAGGMFLMLTGVEDALEDD